MSFGFCALRVSRPASAARQLAAPPLPHQRLVDRVGRPLTLAMVLIKKSYVSLHLIPVYALPWARKRR